MNSVSIILHLPHSCVQRHELKLLDFSSLPGVFQGHFFLEPRDWLTVYIEKDALFGLKRWFQQISCFSRSYLFWKDLVWVLMCFSCICTFKGFTDEYYSMWKNSWKKKRNHKLTDNLFCQWKNWVVVAILILKIGYQN